MGVPCKSWVTLTRSFTRRTSWRPQGPPNSKCSHKQAKYLAEHNSIAERSSHLVALGASVGCLVSVEQPMTSLLFEFGPVKAAMAYSGARMVAVQMSNFCGDTTKPLKLMGNGPHLTKLRQVNTSRSKFVNKCEKKLVTRDGDKFSGKRCDLSASSSYTRTFGIAFALCLTDLDAQGVTSALADLGT